MAVRAVAAEVALPSAAEGAAGEGVEAAAAVAVAAAAERHQIDLSMHLEVQMVAAQQLPWCQARPGSQS